MTLWWIFVDFCCCATILASVFIIFAFRHYVTHVGSAGRPHFLCSRSLFFSSSPFLLLLSYFLLWLGKTAADSTAVQNHGGTILIPWSSPQHMQFSGQLGGFFVFVLDVCLCWHDLPAETGGSSIHPGFNLRMPPRVGADRHVCITAFCLRCWYLSWLKHLFEVLFLRMMRTEDRHCVVL